MGESTAYRRAAKLGARHSARRIPPRAARRAEPVHSGPGAQARQQLLEAAGEVFAEKGYGQATGKEICERAGMNAAAVNYHFGGFDPLYAQTLAHAHRHLMAIDALREIAASTSSPRRKLRAFIGMVVGRLATRARSWEMRLLGREMLSPTPAREALIETEILPKLAVMRGIVAELIGVAPDHPIVGRSLLMVLAPCLMLAIGHRQVLCQIVPELMNASDDIEPLVDHYERFIRAGLKAVAAQLRAERPAPTVRTRAKKSIKARGSTP
jgi:AcrR family transcriptional regulator